MTEFGVHDAGRGPEIETRKVSAEAVPKAILMDSQVTSNELIWLSVPKYPYPDYGKLEAMLCMCAAGG